jgi:hypothetical protein
MILKTLMTLPDWWIHHPMERAGIMIRSTKWPTVFISELEFLQNGEGTPKIKELIASKIELWRTEVNKIADEMRRDLENWKP